MTDPSITLFNALAEFMTQGLQALPPATQQLVVDGVKNGGRVIAICHPSPEPKIIGALELPDQDKCLELFTSEIVENELLH